MSARSEEYRQIIEDLIGSGLLDPDEIAEVREIVENAKRRMAADMAAQSKESAHV